MFTGALPAWTSCVGFEATWADPDAFVALTTTRIRVPTSAAVRMYVELVAPAIMAQLLASGLPPATPHFTHWYANVIGALPVQVPVVALSV